MFFGTVEAEILHSRSHKPLMQSFRHRILTAGVLHILLANPFPVLDSSKCISEVSRLETQRRAIIYLTNKSISVPMILWEKTNPKKTGSGARKIFVRHSALAEGWNPRRPDIRLLRTSTKMA